MITSTRTPRVPTLDEISSDALDLQNASVVARIVLDHCLAMGRAGEVGCYKTLKLLPQQISAITYAMHRVEALSEALAEKIENFPAGDISR